MESENQNIKKEPEDLNSNILYVADLPKETTNEDLSKLFQEYHFKFANLNNFKNNSIWAQVCLENKEWANKARHELNGYILKPINSTNITQCRPIRICKYESKGVHRQNNIKQSLLVKNIDINMTQKEFYNIFLEYGDIVSGKIDYDENGISKGFGYIYYYTEESAENAKKNLNGKLFFGKPLEIVNLIPGKKNKSNTINLFVLNIPKDITEEKLSSIFEQFGPVSNISINPKGFAFISYNNFDSASKCLNQMKTNPISFPGLSPVVVKYAVSKEERESNRIFMNNNFDRNDFVQSNLTIQFNCLYYNPEIKTDLDLDKEIRLFIKVIMLMDYSPKEVLVDFESMSGLVIMEKYSDYNLFFNKYQEFCTKQPTPFECLPYEMPIQYNQYNEDQNNFYNLQNKNQNFSGQGNNMNTPYNQGHNNYMMNNMQRNNNNFSNMNNDTPLGNNMMNSNNYNNMNNRMQMNNMNNPMKKNNRFQGNRNYNNNNMNYKKNNNNGGQNMNNNNKFNNKNNNRKVNIQNPNYINNNNNNQKFIFRQNYGNSYNININMNQNMLPLNPLYQQQMMMMQNQNIPKYNNNYRFNNGRKQMNPMNFQNLNYIQKNSNFLDKNDFMNNYGNDDRQKNDIDLIDQRNLQNLNPVQLLSQFNKPPINLYGPNMLNSKEQEDLVNEIADSIYEIVCAKYPNEASKITGMIKEKGYEKMNMLLSKQEDLNEIIDKAYEMIKNSRNNNKSEIDDNK